MRLRILLPLLAIALSRPAAAQVACPVDSMDLGGYGVFTSTEARFDSSLSYFGEFHVAYDLVAGTVSFSQCCRLPPPTFVQAADAYDVTGVPAGTPVALVVRLTVDGSISTTLCGGSGCGGLYGAEVLHGALTTSVVHSERVYSGSLVFHDVLQLPLTIVAGQPETVAFRLWGNRNVGGSHASEARGVIEFTGLPGGAGIVSCQGYAGGVTPVRTTSWGRLKALYR